MQELFVEADDLHFSHQAKTQVESHIRHKLVEQLGQRSPEQPNIDGAEALKVYQREGAPLRVAACCAVAAHGLLCSLPSESRRLPRCSSYAAMMRCTSGWRTTSRLV